MANSYKALKEDFVSNLTGGSIGEINLVTAVAPAAYLLWAVLQSRQGFFREPGSALAALADFGLNVGGILLATTLYAAAPGLLLALLLAPALGILVTTRCPAEKSTLPVKPRPRDPGASTPADPAPPPPPPRRPAADLPVRPFLTAYRGAMMVVTCHAILAVDFRAFPRRFAKVETWGTSVMDLGVGSFVFSGGLVAARAHLRARHARETRARTDASGGSGGGSSGPEPTLVQRLAAALRHALPLLALGAVRLISVKNLEYAEHVSEYGVHWNFFFTLALLPVALALLDPLLATLPGPGHGVVGVALALLYEGVLQRTGLKAWALTAPRTSLLAQNKEGAVSWLGYLAVFLCGLETGTLVLPRALPRRSLVARALARLAPRSARGDDPRRARIELLLALAASCAVYAALLAPFLTPALAPALSIPVSRRLANAPYVLWVAAFNTGQLLLFALVETALFPRVHRAPAAATASWSDAERRAAAGATSRVLADFNAGGLPLFLAANLGTGAVNLGVRTLEVRDGAAVGVLLAYLAALAAVARALARYKIKI